MPRYYPNWIQAYMQYSSKSEAPDKFHFWTAISTVAGAMRRQVWIDQGYFEWTPCFYIIFVAPPGIVSKSTTASIGMNLLRQVPGIQFGPDAATWQALAMAFAQATEMVEISEQYHPMSALTISSSEFGTFLNPHDREMVDLLVSLWDGQRGVWKKATKTSGDDQIENPWINLIACTTPAWIAGTFPEYMIGGGFTSRCIFVYADQKRHLVPYPGRIIPEDFKVNEQKLVHDLELISQIRGEYKLAEEAIAYGESWYQDLYNNRPKHLDNDRLAGYLARKQTHLHKIAMVLSASRRDNLVITVEDIEEADQLLVGIESDMPKVFGRIGLNDISKCAQDIVMYLEHSKNGEISQTLLYNNFVGRILFREFQEALQSVLACGAATAATRGNELYVRRNFNVETPLSMHSSSGPVAPRSDDTPEVNSRSSSL